MRLATDVIRLGVTVVVNDQCAVLVLEVIHERRTRTSVLAVAVAPRCTAVHLEVELAERDVFLQNRTKNVKLSDNFQQTIKYFLGQLKRTQLFFFHTRHMFNCVSCDAVFI